MLLHRHVARNFGGQVQPGSTGRRDAATGRGVDAIWSAAPRRVSGAPGTAVRKLLRRLRCVSAGAAGEGCRSRGGSLSEKNGSRRSGGGVRPGIGGTAAATRPVCGGCRGVPEVSLGSSAFRA